MNYHELHERAERLARERGITHEEALSILGKHGAAKRRHVYGVLHPMRADREAFANVEQPHYPWQDRADLQ